MALLASITATLSATLSSGLDLQTVSVPGNLAAAFGFDSTLGNGATVNAADMVWGDTNTLAPSANVDLDFAGTLVGALGTTLTFARLKAIMVRAAAGNTNNVVMSRGASNGVPIFGSASNSMPILPGGTFLWVAPGAGVIVTPATGDLINFANSGAGTSVTYDIFVIGASA